MARRTKEQVAEELRDAVEEEEQQVEERVEAAAEEAGADAEAKGYSEEDVNAIKEKVRKEEKDKLYKKIEGLQEGLKEVQDALKAERADKDKIKREAEAEAERKRKEALSADERQTEILTRLEERLNEEREERLKKDKELAQEKKYNNLKEYRRNVIQAAEDKGDKFIVDLVGGNSEEEIDESIEFAKARYKEYFEEFQAEHSQKVKGSMPRSTSPGMEALEEEELSEQLNAIDEERLQTDPKYRAQVQNELAQVYARSRGMA